MLWELSLYYLISLERKLQMKLQILFTMLICFLVTQLALAGEAQDEQPWNRHEGPYAEMNLGTGFAYLGLLSGTAGIAEDYNASTYGINGFSWVGALGYSFTPHHAAEGGFGQWYADFEDVDHYDEDVSTNLNFGYLAWRGTLPIKDRFAVFVKLGGMLISIPDTSADEWLLRPFTGIGMSYAVTPELELSVQYQGAVYAIYGAGALTAGATYRF